MMKQPDDCYFYYYSNCSKGAECKFRHEEAARGSEVTCRLWKEGKCFHQGCTFRHMIIQKDRSQIPCYWQSQPSGCQKQHCPFLHLPAQSKSNCATSNNNITTTASSIDTTYHEDANATTQQCKVAYLKKPYQQQLPQDEPHLQQVNSTSHNDIKLSSSFLPRISPSSPAKSMKKSSSSLSPPPPSSLVTVDATNITTTTTKMLNIAYANTDDSINNGCVSAYTVACINSTAVSNVNVLSPLPSSSSSSSVVNEKSNDGDEMHDADDNENITSNVKDSNVQTKIQNDDNNDDDEDGYNDDDDNVSASANTNANDDDKTDNQAEDNDDDNDNNNDADDDTSLEQMHRERALESMRRRQMEKLRNEKLNELDNIISDNVCNKKNDDDDDMGRKSGNVKAVKGGAPLSLGHQPRRIVIKSDSRAVATVKPISPGKNDITDGLNTNHPHDQQPIRKQQENFTRAIPAFCTRKVQITNECKVNRVMGIPKSRKVTVQVGADAGSDNVDNASKELLKMKVKDRLGKREVDDATFGKYNDDGNNKKMKFTDDGDDNVEIVVSSSSVTSSSASSVTSVTSSSTLLSIKNRLGSSKNSDDFSSAGDVEVITGNQDRRRNQHHHHHHGDGDVVVSVNDGRSDGEDEDEVEKLKQKVIFISKSKRSNNVKDNNVSSSSISKRIINNAITASTKSRRGSSNSNDGNGNCKKIDDQILRKKVKSTVQIYRPPVAVKSAAAESAARPTTAAANCAAITSSSRRDGAVASNDARRKLDVDRKRQLTTGVPSGTTADRNNSIIKNNKEITGLLKKPLQQQKRNNSSTDEDVDGRTTTATCNMTSTSATTSKAASSTSSFLLKRIGSRSNFETSTANNNKSNDDDNKDEFLSINNSRKMNGDVVVKSFEEIMLEKRLKSEQATKSNEHKTQNISKNSRFAQPQHQISSKSDFSNDEDSSSNSNDASDGRYTEDINIKYSTLDFPLNTATAKNETDESLKIPQQQKQQKSPKFSENYSCGVSRDSMSSNNKNNPLSTYSLLKRRKLSIESSLSDDNNSTNDNNNSNEQLNISNNNDYNLGSSSNCNNYNNDNGNNNICDSNISIMDVDLTANRQEGRCHTGMEWTSNQREATAAASSAASTAVVASSLSSISVTASSSSQSEESMFPDDLSMFLDLSMPSYSNAPTVDVNDDELFREMQQLLSSS